MVRVKNVEVNVIKSTGTNFMIVSSLSLKFLIFIIRNSSYHVLFFMKAFVKLPTKCLELLLILVCLKIIVSLTFCQNQCPYNIKYLQLGKIYARIQSP